jgi:hypothetical protein
MTKASCEVVVVFEDSSTRDAAVRFCDELVKRFWAQSHFEVNWFSFRDLAAPENTTVAAQKAIGADLLVFSLRPFTDLPSEIKSWARLWENDRREREGAVVGLGDPTGVGAMPGASFTWLRQLAHHIGLDYLTKVPPGMVLPFPDAPEPYTDRANQHSTVLDGILEHRVPPNPLSQD